MTTTERNIRVIQSGRIAEHANGIIALQHIVKYNGRTVGKFTDLGRAQRHADRYTPAAKVVSIVNR